MITQDNMHEVAIKVNSGSGVLVQIDQKPFVITLNHCLLESDNKITNYNESITYPIKEYFYHKDKIEGLNETNKDDIVLVQVDCPKHNLLVEIATYNITVGDTIQVYGFPNKGENNGTPLGGKISKWHDTKTIQTDLPYIGSNSNMMPAISNISGWSGSGLFKEIEKKLYLIGLLKKLIDEEHTYQSINCIPIDTIMEVIEYNQLGSFNLTTKNHITNLEELENLRYINQLIKSYDSDAPNTIRTIEDVDESKYANHFKRARISFRMVEDLRQLSRDNLPEGTYEEFQEDMYDGIINKVEKNYKNAFLKVEATEDESTKIIIESYPSFEGKKLRPKERKGVCHQLVNDKKISWIKDE